MPPPLTLASRACGLELVARRAFKQTDVARVSLLVTVIAVDAAGVRSACVCAPVSASKQAYDCCAALCITLNEPQFDKHFVRFAFGIAPASALLSAPRRMGLNEFVSLFYGSAQSLHVNSGGSSTNKLASTSTYSLPTAADVKEFRQMLKNHKNVQAKKYSYKDYPNDMKYGKNLNASQIYATQQQQQQPVVAATAAAKKLLNNNNNSSSHKNNNNNSGIGKAANGKAPPATRIPTKLTATCSSGSSSSSSMDVQRSSKQKSASSASSFLWNSFRLPRRQKAAAAADKKQAAGE